MRAKLILCLTTVGSRVEIWQEINLSPKWLWILCPFKGGGSAVIYPSLIIAPIACEIFVLGSCFVLQFFVSFLVLQSTDWGRES